MSARGTCQQDLSNRMAPMGPENPALAQMDRAISQLGAHARRLAMTRKNMGTPTNNPSAGVARAIFDIRQAIASVLEAGPRASSAAEILREATRTTSMDTRNNLWLGRSGAHRFD